MLRKYERKKKSINLKLSKLIKTYKQCDHIVWSVEKNIWKKISNINNAVMKTDYNTKINEIENKITTGHGHDKYITTQEFYKLTWEKSSAKFTSKFRKHK